MTRKQLAERIFDLNKIVLPNFKNADKKAFVKNLLGGLIGYQSKEELERWAANLEERAAAI